MSQIILTADDVDAIVLRLDNKGHCFGDEVSSTNHELRSTIHELRSASRLNNWCNFLGIDGAKRYIFDTNKISAVMALVK